MATEKKPRKKKEKSIIAYKAFDKNLKCRDFQYAVGETYKHDGEVKACKSGFHSCENPLDILNYYPLVNDDGVIGRFAIVEASGAISKDKEGNDSKLASAEITIKAEIMLPELVKTAINFVMDFCKKKKVSGDSAKLAASGHYAKLAASGHYAKLAASGDSAIVAGLAAYCIATAGENGCIVLSRWVSDEKRWRVSVGYTGENGIKANTAYKLDNNGNFVEAK